MPTGNKVFAPAIFFIAFREALEAALVIGILSGMLERIVDVRKVPQNEREEQEAVKQRQLIRKLRRYIFFGALSGLLIAFIIGAAFLAVFYTQTTDLYGRSEELWEGIFNLIAVLLITPMSLAILRADRSRGKWRRKLARAFAGLEHPTQTENEIKSEASELQRQSSSSTTTKEREQPNQEKKEGAEAVHSPSSEVEAPHLLQQQSASHEAAAPSSPAAANSDAKHGKMTLKQWVRVVRRPFEGEARGATAIFVIPFITTLREGLEGVVFIGGVSLGLPASSIPLPAIVGLFAGLLCGYIVFRAGSFSRVKIFLVASTAALLVIAAGMISRSIYYLQFYRYVQKVGDAAAEGGNGPGSYDALNYLWHLDCCNPEDKTDNGGSGWSVLNSLVGWNNTANLGSVLVYILYWMAIVLYLVYCLVDEKLKQKGKKGLLHFRASSS